MTTVDGRADHNGTARLVLISDSPTDAMVLESMLAEGASMAFELICCDTLPAGLQAIANRRPDAVLVDLGLPGSDPLGAVDAIVCSRPDLAIVVLTGSDDLAAGESAIKRGAQDCVAKGNAGNEVLTRTIRHAIERKRWERSAPSHLPSDQLARSRAELEQLAYVASHDLSEPLRTVGGFVQLLAQRYQGRLDDDADEFITFALDGVKRMQNLIEDLLTFSRVSRLDYQFDNVDSQVTASDVGEAIEPAGTVTYSQLPMVFADRGQLRRVFEHLIGNGVKFVPPGRPPHVHVSAVRDGPYWRFEVKDNGIGVPARHADRIFKMFQQLHRRDDSPGTGIGLALCQRIVERHGGRIWVESTDGEGSAFCFTLPVPGP